METVFHVFNTNLAVWTRLPLFCFCHSFTYMIVLPLRSAIVAELEPAITPSCNLLAGIKVCDGL